MFSLGRPNLPLLRLALDTLGSPHMKHTPVGFCPAGAPECGHLPWSRGVTHPVRLARPAPRTPQPRRPDRSPHSGPQIGCPNSPGINNPPHHFGGFTRHPTRRGRPPQTLGGRAFDHSLTSHCSLVSGAISQRCGVTSPGVGRYRPLLRHEWGLTSRRGAGARARW